MSEGDEEQVQRLTRLASTPGAPDTSDIPEAEPGVWSAAEIGRFHRPRKETVTLQLDADVLDWFRQGDDRRTDQTAINAALRAHISNPSR